MEEEGEMGQQGLGLGYGGEAQQIWGKVRKKSRGDEGPLDIEKDVVE